jgi:hypothetical protein
MDALKRVEELKRKIEELQSGSAESALPAAAGKNEFSLDFVESENIHEIETGIRETLSGIALSKAALCKALANIDTKKLYKQVKAGNFLEYLEMARIPLNYKTAKEYAKIGDTMLRFREELTSVDFREEDGLKKLVYLDKALDKCGEDREVVFEKVKESSLRDFQQWIRELEEEEQEESTCHTIDETGRPRPDIRLRNNSVFLETGPGKREEIIVTRPAEMGIDPDSPKWAGFLEQLRELLITFIQDNG